MTKTPRQAIPLPEAPALLPSEDFGDKLAALGVTLDPPRVALLGDYLARLLAMNQHMNLTGITDPTEVWSRHVLDALSLLPLLSPLGAGSKIVDVGSGGGLPGIPLAIARPELGVMLLESTQKKAGFLSAVAKALGLANVSVRAARAESMGCWDLRRTLDVATARAVGRIAALVPIIGPLVKPGGRILLIKGQLADQELSEASEVLKQQHLSHETTLDTPTGRIVVLRQASLPWRVNSRRES